MSGFDKIYRKSLLSRIFVKGWGNPSVISRIIENHRVVSKTDTCKHLIKSFEIKISNQTVDSTSTSVEGSFISPFHKLLPDVMDENNQVAKFQLFIPKKWTSKYRPLCIHYAGTGDHNYSRRKLFLANRLLKDGIASLIHINPYYGCRKPDDQRGSSLNYLSDLFVMGGSLILEAQVLLQWGTKEGFGPLALHGISMGGHMACLGASVYPEPVCLIPCLSWTTASHVFTEGAMSPAVSWNVLSQQYHNDDVYRQFIRSAIEPPIPYRLKKLNNEICKNNDLKFSSKISKQPLDTVSRKLHILTLNQSDQQIMRQFSNTNNESNNSNIQNNKSFWLNFQRLKLMEMLPLIRTFSDKEKITKEEMAEIDLMESQYTKNTKFKRLFSHKELVVDNDTIEFMRDILDFFTHLGNYSVPVDTRLVTAVVAENDAYIPINGVAHFSDVWDTRCQVDILKDVGHVGAYLRNSVWTDDNFREAIVRTLNRYVELYHNEPGPFGIKKQK